MISLNLNMEIDEYDEYLEREFPSSKRPIFPYDWRKDRVKVGPVSWEHDKRRSPRDCPDPYGGDAWTCTFLGIFVEVSTFVDWTMRVWVPMKRAYIGWPFHKELSFWTHDWFASESIRPWALWFGKKIFEWLEYRRSWYMYNEYVEDPMGYLGDYE